jgi:hypothetical protein
MTRRIQAAAAIVAFALGGGAPGADQKAIQASIQKGIDRLWEDQDPDSGAWRYNDKETEIKKDDRAVGVTSLAALALFENGVLPSDPKLRKALKFVRERCPLIEDTYSVSLATILLARVGQREDKDLLKENAQRLCNSQKETGGWHYTTPRISRDKKKASDSKGLGDFSVTQFAVLGLWQAQRAGCGGKEATEALRKLRMRLAWAQTENGGWNYPGVPDLGGDSHTMTTAGIYMWLVSSANGIKTTRLANKPTLESPTSHPIFAILQTAAEEHKKSAAKSNQGKAKEADGPGGVDYTYPTPSPPAIDVTVGSPLAEDQFLKKAMKRVGEHADAAVSNSGYGNWIYYLWSLQRLGVLLGEEKFGKTAWYDAGCDALIKKQNEDGSFGPKEGSLTAKADSAFALLFLRKANLGSDITKLLNKDSDTPFSIVERPAQKFGKLVEAIAAAQPKETVLIRGDGPFEVAGLALDKPITLRAALGYEPIFKYVIPKDKYGATLDVRHAPEFQCLLRCKGALAQFEGIRFQMDPPTDIDVPLTVVKIEGAPVHFLNCSFTTASKKPNLGFEIVDSPRFFMRNSFLVGFTPAFKVVANKGKTEKGTRLTLCDTVIYSPELVVASGDGDARMFCVESTLQFRNGFKLDGHKGSFGVTSENCVVQGSELIAALGEGERFWTGRKTLYDVETWVAKGDSKATSISQLDQWKRYWESDEEKSAQTVAPFALYRRQVGGFNHGLNPKDWELKDEGIRRAMPVKVQDQVGANAYYVGPGEGLLQFLEAGDYKGWVRADLPSKRGKS